MKKNKYRIITIITYILISLLASFMTYNYVMKKENELLEKKYLSFSLNLHNKIASLINKKKNATLALTITLANNKEVIEVIENRSFKSKKLNELSLFLRKETDFKNVWFQVLDNKGVSLYRSWSEKRGDDLSIIRSDVSSMLKEPKVKSTISVGRYDMTFKAMVPIFENDKFVGIIESITHFNSISRGLRKNDSVEPIILVEEKFSKQLIHPFTQLFIENHYVANISANVEMMNKAEKIGVKKLLKGDGYLVSDGFLITKYPIYFSNNKLATFLTFKKLSDIDTNSIKDYKNNTFLYLGLFILLLGLILYVISYYLYSREITTLVNKLNKNQKDLKKLNETLKETVDKEVAKNDKKNKIMFHQSKLAAMGEMIENIAHQWRQPLSIISTAASGIKLKKELDVKITKEEEVEILDMIVSTSQYLSNTIDDFRFFFSQDKQKTFFDIKILVERSLKLIEKDFLSKDIKIIKKLHSVKVSTFESEILQVILNILNNAKDEFMRKDSKNRIILIKTYNRKEKLFIEVQDNAGGIDNKIIDRVFEPYFTTKHKNQGTGIGLYMSQEIVTKHMNGAIRVKNSILKYDDENQIGAHFIIEIPID